MTPKAKECRDSFSLYSVLIGVPLDRFAEMGGVARFFSVVIGALLTLLNKEALAGILLLVLASSIVDHYVSRVAATRAGVYDPLLGRIALLTKFSAFAMVLLVRGFEWWGAVQHIPGLGATKGFISCALAVGLFVMDLESIEHARIALKARPIPGFSRLVAYMRDVELRLFPPLPETTHGAAAIGGAGAVPDEEPAS